MTDASLMEIDPHSLTFRMGMVIRMCLLGRNLTLKHQTVRSSRGIGVVLLILRDFWRRKRGRLVHRKVRKRQVVEKDRKVMSDGRGDLDWRRDYLALSVNRSRHIWEKRISSFTTRKKEDGLSQEKMSKTKIVLSPRRRMMTNLATVDSAIRQIHYSRRLIPARVN